MVRHEPSTVDKEGNELTGLESLDGESLDVHSGLRKMPPAVVM